MDKASKKPSPPETIFDALHFLNNNITTALEDVVYQLEEINKSLTELAEKNIGGNEDGWNKRYKFKR
tara:strand:+ start:70 stop:270 length:201 start_codon:yes stop_codon:yes gene_type:complete